MLGISIFGRFHVIHCRSTYICFKFNFRLDGIGSKNSTLDKWSQMSDARLTVYTTCTRGACNGPASRREDLSLPVGKDLSLPVGKDKE